MGLGSAVLFFIGCIAVVLIYGLWASWDARKQSDSSDKQGEAANSGALKALISAVLEDARTADLGEGTRALSAERANGKGWDSAIKAALPKIANVQLLQLRNDIVALIGTGKSEQEAIEITLRAFLRPPKG
jgi:hypothetical protein